ncbi:transcriptional regulator [Bradyrhizobium elkanii]|uniref:transcriptional regulator n=1 Tax=Bradyrhizobium elkanii TaxID=29448 RepID=UPI00216882D6|nr:transcriptional regulator [Bradyrhizobium elkanii]MCS3519277.1 hypothetical protein [Bradyrhizobium elkanii]MCS4066934.1 hypothetical protein [Bradyrhizobium elkanii]MCS4082469.1 hypothetical protein [Bradyrhizobium elkanii]MCW2127912.1 hypothetical protein [Bradyrhizobium elkanii]MCW2174655.1 hypothetical protein [Bradyrhizobium elkanii]
MADKADVRVNTVNRFEDGQDARLSSVEKMRRARESAGVIFLADGQSIDGVRLTRK